MKYALLICFSGYAGQFHESKNNLEKKNETKTKLSLRKYENKNLFIGDNKIKNPVFFTKYDLHKSGKIC